jgi:hypothetical protein
MIAVRGGPERGSAPVDCHEVRIPLDHAYFTLQRPGEVTVHWDPRPIETISGVGVEEFERFTDAIGRPTFLPPPEHPPIQPIAEDPQGHAGSRTFRQGRRRPSE